MIHTISLPKQLFLFLLLILLANIRYNLHANDLQFIPLNSSSLPTNEVRNLYQDNDGYIWISTYNGLLRFDGYSNIVYRPNGIDPTHNINGFVNIVSEDNNHKLWIGTNNGLYVLDKQKGSIKKIISPLLQVSHIEALECTSKGEIWVGANKGIFRKRAGNNTFELCDSQIQETNSPYFDVKSIIEDSNGNIWIGTWAQGLLRYDPKSDRFYTYRNINPSQSAHTLFEDNKGNIWIGTWRHGLIKMENPYDMDNFLNTSNMKKTGKKVCAIISYIQSHKTVIPENYGLAHVADSVFLNRKTETVHSATICPTKGRIHYLSMKSMPYCTAGTDSCGLVCLEEVSIL